MSRHYLPSTSPVRAGLLCAALFAIGLVAAAAALRAQDFYAGKMLVLVVGSDPGTGYDVYGRTVGRRLVEHIPGKPTLVVQNMTGAGSIRATEYIANIAPRDGSTIAIVFPGAMMAPLTAKYRYDPAKLEYLGTADSGTRLCSTSLKAKVQTFDQALKEEALIGSSAPGGSTFDYPQMLRSLTGAKFKLVTGYKATTDIAIAVDRGEVDGWCGVDVSTYEAVRPQWLEEKSDVNHLLQLGIEKSEAMTKLGFPWVMDYVTGENRQVMELIVSQQVFQRPFIAPPGTPEARLVTLRAAFDATMVDPEFLADAKKSKLAVNPRTGQQVKELVERLYATPQALIDRMNAAIKP